MIIDNQLSLVIQGLEFIIYLKNSNMAYLLAFLLTFEFILRILSDCENTDNTVI